MTPFERGWHFYGAEWFDTLEHYCARYFVYASPTALCLAKPEDGAWWIEFMAGDMKEALGHLPFWLPVIRFSRNGIVKAYATATLVNKILKDDPVQNGPADAPVWWRWPCGSCQTASTAITYHSSGECGQGQDSTAAA